MFVLNVLACSVLTVMIAVGPQVAVAASPFSSGSIAFRGQLPWHAGLFKAADSSSGISVTNLLGSGALVSQNYVLTAASVVKGAAQVQVLLATLTLDKPYTPIGVNKMIPHQEDDIALLQLEAPVMLEAQDYLSILNLQVISNADCQAKQINPDQRLPWTKMCAVGNGPCNGDVGDPVVFMEADDVYTLVGIVSSDLQCLSDRPTILTRVAVFLDWISANSDVPPQDDTLKTMSEQQLRQISDKSAPATQ